MNENIKDVTVADVLKNGGTAEEALRVLLAMYKDQEQYLQRYKAEIERLQKENDELQQYKNSWRYSQEEVAKLRKSIETIKNVASLM